ncbi:hypothetical protein BuS5_00470 [Desulfosarcina sp. BuS5]|uniref:hypothetical protein n=1 Tax=Desulfosarcina sp. BuS5 TaxID=933262 RepID=UPI0004806DB2|nr:hypothetical protein [Desulfosarcina sp. BuS5]WDN87502.1 hypothetical protein BuS5_00470 [Desulfosarcina sp. BuS5]
MDKEKNKKEMELCPIGKFYFDFGKAFGKKSKFYEHMTRSRVEFFKGIRSLVDAKIEVLEKKASAGDKKEMTRIKVE